MEAFLIHNMAPIMFGCLVILLLLGYPVAFALAANGLVFALIGIELGLFPTNFLQALPERVYGVGLASSYQHQTLSLSKHFRR